MDGKGGGGVRVTGQGWVGDGGAGPEVGAEGARPGGGEANRQGARSVKVMELRMEGIFPGLQSRRCGGHLCLYLH